MGRKSWDLKLLPFMKKPRGFGLIEVLISAVILAVGLIGLASLQNRSIRAIQEGDNLVTAAMIAQEMAKRMLTNPYITSLGRQGYLATDLNNDVASAGGVTAWAATTLSANPNIENCYSDPDTTQSCYDPSATIGNSGDHIQALQNMQLMDQVEMRLLAWNSLPQGEIMICFDSTGAETLWTCDDVATRVSDRKENVFTIKVQWTNILSKVTQMYALQFTAQCTDGGATFCG
jgi:type IV pilus modification protein PilV